MLEVIREFARYDDHNNVDASVVIILSHGEHEGRIFGIDNRTIKDEIILSFFTATNCPALAEKPKIFLFVACQGGWWLGSPLYGPTIIFIGLQTKKIMDILKRLLL